MASERERVRFVRASKLYDTAARERTLAYRLLGNRDGGRNE
jgi:hypothetical protein